MIAGCTHVCKVESITQKAVNMKVIKGLSHSPPHTLRTSKHKYYLIRSSLITKSQDIVSLSLTHMLGTDMLVSYKCTGHNNNLFIVAQNRETNDVVVNSFHCIYQLELINML